MLSDLKLGDKFKKIGTTDNKLLIRIVVILLFFLVNTLKWKELSGNIKSEIFWNLEIYYLIVLIALTFLLLLGFFYRRSWKYYLPFILPVAVIVTIAINLSSFPAWRPERNESFSLTELVRNEGFLDKGRGELYSFWKNYSVGKKIIAYAYDIPLLDIRYYLLINSDREFKYYPYYLSSERYLDILKKKLKTFSYQISRRRKINFSFWPESEKHQTDSLYILLYQTATNSKKTASDYYKLRHFFVVPKRYFAEIKTELKNKWLITEIKDFWKYWEK